MGWEIRYYADKHQQKQWNWFLEYLWQKMDLNVQLGISFHK